MPTNYEVVQQTIPRYEHAQPYDPAWIAVEAPAGKFVVNYYGEPGVNEGLRFNRQLGYEPRLVTDGSGRVTAVEFRQSIYDPVNNPEAVGVDYDVFVICVDG